MSTRSQHGYASAVVLTLLAALLLTGLLSTARSRDTGLDRARETRQALARARQALIDYAASGPHAPGYLLGSLPCPDLRNDGYAPALCPESSRRLGRLPWRTLGLPDLRDGDGERLWYAVSSRFVDAPFVTPCPTPGASTCLNADTPGTITLHAQDGSLVTSGSSAGGAVAVLLAPGAALTRVGSAAAQDRSCLRGGAVDATCNGTGVCAGANLLVGGHPDYQQTARCNPLNYLDVAGPPVLSVAGATGGVEDNAAFVDGSAADGLIEGPIRDGAGHLVVNDALVTLRTTDLMPLLQQRVGGDVLRCLSRYAGANGGHYPWTAAPDRYAPQAGPTTMVAGNTFGRVPDEATLAPLASAGLATAWGAGCPLTGTPVWWTHWREQVFVAIAPPDAPGAAGGPCGAACLQVGPAAAPARVVVLVSGQALAGTPVPQVHAAGVAASNYLEGGNAAGGPVFTTGTATATFNDVALHE